MNTRKTLILLLHAFVVWGLCGATMAIGPQFMSMDTTLIVHAIGAPIFSALVSLFYYKKFHFTTPLQTAGFIFLFIAVMDAGLVAPVFEKNFEMFESAIGTWIPFTLIFTASYVTGRFIEPQKAWNRGGRQEEIGRGVEH